MLQFTKYHGTGNDFILIDNRDRHFDGRQNDIAFLCHRRFGIGADGLILLEKEDREEYDFRMVYYNADGRQSSMCGNGGRCVVQFAKDLGIIADRARFSAVDGSHAAFIANDMIALKMKDVKQFETIGSDYCIDTGSPHYVRFVDDLSAINIGRQGRLIRNSERFKAQGINVNFVESHTAPYRIRTYERGVEAETYSCGTGVTAAALALALSKKTTNMNIPLETLGGLLNVTFEKDVNGFKDIWLKGPAQRVFSGKINQNIPNSNAESLYVY